MAIKYITKMCTILVISLLYIGTVHSIRCYQCTSTNNTHPFQCNEYLTSDIDVEPESCDAIFGAQYCVKHVGRFEALECYQCTSADEWQCSDGELIENSLQPINCSHVYEAHYCVKTVGRYGGLYSWFIPLNYSMLWSRYKKILLDLELGKLLQLCTAAWR
ncbi:uncharacterized protein LOC122515210 isoform X2 [Polistes fuscatus]|uniref:uncharacterized protein LOC122515210 isoform X2 n=1 Tax=Polistes fuscatus TaxID=30207 RepID=UPI001CA9CAC9|nr:uncharacterized protein LOC122515210 isoform X2 [Polistes fuscatus]